MNDLCAVIPAAGFGTRMLPATKSMPKEMMPILDKPTIQYVVEEAVAAGIEHIIIVTGRHKRAVEDHFDSNPELEMLLEEKGKFAELESVRNTVPGARFTFVRQSRPLGLGHAILQAKHAVGDRPFAVLLGDDLVFGERPAVGQLMDARSQTGASVLAVQHVSDDDVGKYGIVEVEGATGSCRRLRSIVEKPPAGEAPSNLASIGRYVFDPVLFEYLERTKPGVGGEIQLTDAVQAMLAEHDVWCMEFEGTRYDAGSLEGWLQTNLALAKKDTRLSHQLDGWICS